VKLTYTGTRGWRRWTAAGAMVTSLAMASACSTASSGDTTASAGGGSTANACPNGKGDVPADLVAAVDEAKKSSPPWNGPTTGPAAQKGKLIVDVSQDQTNAGNNGVSAGLKEAADKLGWQVKRLNGGGNLTGMVSALHQAIALKPDGIALESVPTDGTLPVLQEAAKDGIATFEVAKIAGAYAVVTSCGKAHAVELTDMTYPIDQEKNNGFQAAFKESSTSSITIDDYPFGSRSTRTSGEITSTIEKDKNVNWFVTINDSYFDYSIPALTAAGFKPGGPIFLNSAGDGSPSAFQRIRQGDFQVDTVPEPLNEQGWIMADEFNRAFNNEQPFDFVTKPHLTVKENVDADGGQNNVYDPGNGYRDRFAAIWKVQ
jgi:ribose transport system substrate-binding protein